MTSLLAWWFVDVPHSDWAHFTGSWIYKLFYTGILRRARSTGSTTKSESNQLTQCVDGWQWDACGLNDTNRVVFLKNAVPPAPMCIGKAHGICSCARSRSKIGINSAKCSSTTQGQDLCELWPTSPFVL